MKDLHKVEKISTFDYKNGENLFLFMKNIFGRHE